MIRRVAYLAVIAASVAALGGCAAFSFFDVFVPRAPWRDAEERACVGNPAQLAEVTYSRAPRINGRGSCGINAPLMVAGFSNGAVNVTPTATLNCPLTSALDTWMTNAVEPAAMAWFGMPVVAIKQADSYDCRTVDSIPGESMSEHAFGDAIDISGYTLADARTITVKKDFLRGEPAAKGFLHEIFAAACATFKTVLGPGYPEHDDHFHLDLAHHNESGTSRYCNPKPDVPVPSRPLYGPAVASTPSFPVIRSMFGLDARATGSISTPSLR